MGKKINFFGVDVSVTNPADQRRILKGYIAEKQPRYVTYTNVHVLVEAVSNPDLRTAVNSADIVSPDGMPLIVFGRLRGGQYMSRCSGPDMFEEILKLSEEEGFTNYFYGSTDDTLKKMKEEIIRKYPKIRIAGMYSPPFRALTEEEDQKIADEINRLSPDVIWIGLGAPKQEIWMYNHKGRIEQGVMFGVGAAFDFMAGKVKRAPKWAQKIGFEWFYRMLREPRRLWKRYLVTNSLFFLYLVRDLFKKAERKKE